eukprot:GHVQ01015180.1.p1 GENE.GHVQ01015180.1~~GHVQ01015180.1.p1  ORF type:complete len:125 (+),score=22.25 GHVQ01015180.1:716-1090(+)
MKAELSAVKQQNQMLKDNLKQLKGQWTQSITNASTTQQPLGLAETQIPSDNSQLSEEPQKDCVKGENKSQSLSRDQEKLDLLYKVSATEKALSELRDKLATEMAARREAEEFIKSNSHLLHPST